MGVRGLATFIARNSDKYFEDYQLHNTYLVVDGNNIASHLYKWYSKSNDCFGGDYNQFAKVIANFYTLLSQCKVVPLVVLDGAYEDKKLKTVYQRLKSRIQVAKILDSTTESSISVFPLFLREVFVDVTLKLNVKAVRCENEADYEMACLAKALDCPLLSYDSDFYIFDVLYVPFSVFTLPDCGDLSGRQHIDCKIYRVEKFLRYWDIKEKNSLLLLAVYLGNDYVKKRIITNFTLHLKAAVHKKTTGEKIGAFISWLKHESYDSALAKILDRLKSAEKKIAEEQIKTVTEGYICKESALASHFKLQGNATKSTETPDPFLVSYKKCLYPSCFMDMMQHGIYFCVPQLEDFTKVHSHDISLPIVTAIYKILTSGKPDKLVCVVRNNDFGGLRKLFLPVCDKNLPALAEVGDLNEKSGENLLLDILDLNFPWVYSLLDSLSEFWRLYILGITYWIKNSERKVTKQHIISVILCGMLLNPSAIDGMEKSKQKEYGNCKTHLRHFFKMPQQMRTNVTLYNIEIVDTFARLQSVILHVKYLNTLLNQPFKTIFISNFYNGTFVYNLCAETSDFLGNLLEQNFPRLSETLGKVVQALLDQLEVASPSLAVVKKKRRRKNRKKKCELIEQEVIDDSECENDGFCSFDANNKYAVLNFVNT